MDREALLRRRRELYRQHRERETPEEREVRLSRRRDYYRRRRAALSIQEYESNLRERRTTYSTDASTNAQAVDRSELVQNSGSSADQGYAELPRFDHPDVTAKITEFHTYVDSLQSAKCEVCLEQFPNLRVDSHQCCRRCATDKHVPKLFSCQNNMNPGAVPPELTVSC